MQWCTPSTSSVGRRHAWRMTIRLGSRAFDAPSKRSTCCRFCTHHHLATGPETTVSYPQASASEFSALLRRPAGAKMTNDSSSLHNPEVKAVLDGCCPMIIPTLSGIDQFQRPWYPPLPCMNQEIHHVPYPLHIYLPGNGVTQSDEWQPASKARNPSPNQIIPSYLHHLEFCIPMITPRVDDFGTDETDGNAP